MLTLETKSNISPARVMKIDEYAFARNSLEREYSHPCSIADAKKDQLKTAKVAKPNEPKSLRPFSNLIKKIVIALENIFYCGNSKSFN